MSINSGEIQARCSRNSHGMTCLLCVMLIFCFEQSFIPGASANMKKAFGKFAVHVVKAWSHARCQCVNPSLSLESVTAHFILSNAVEALLRVRRGNDAGFLPSADGMVSSVHDDNPSPNAGHMSQALAFSTSKSSSLFSDAKFLKISQ